MKKGEIETIIEDLTKKRSEQCVKCGSKARLMKKMEIKQFVHGDGVKINSTYGKVHCFTELK